MTSLPSKVELNRDGDPCRYPFSEKPRRSKQRGAQRPARRRNELHICRAQDQNRRWLDTSLRVYESFNDDATFDSCSPHGIRTLRLGHPHQHGKDIRYRTADEWLDGPWHLADAHVCRRLVERCTNGGRPVQSRCDGHRRDHRVHDEPLERGESLSSRQVIVHGRLSAVSISEIPTTGDRVLARQLRNGDNRVWIYPRGNSTVNVVPLPGRLCTSIVPPCASAIHLQIARPSPVPARSLVRVRAESARQKRSKTFGRSPGAIPMPVSATVNTARASLLPSSTETCPPRGVYFTAFSMRLSASCRMRLLSTARTSGSGGRRISMPTPACSASSSPVSPASAMMSRRSAGSRCRSARPSSARASVSSDSSSSVMRFTSWSVSSRAASVSGGMSGRVIARSTPARTTVSGVFSSWLASAVKRRNAEKLRSSRVII